MRLNRHCITPFIFIVSVIFLIEQTGFAQGIRYWNHGEYARLSQISNLYVVGTQTEVAEAARKNTMQSIPLAVEASYLGRGLTVVKTAAPIPSNVNPAKSVSRDDGGVQFVYPVYHFAGSDLKVYPTPEIVVCIQEGVDINVIAKRHGLTVVRNILYADEQFVVKIDPTLNPFQVSNELRADPGVVWANVNFARQIEKRFKPNDPMYSKQWHLNNTGQNGAVSGADISAEAAWDLQMPSADIVIAVVDDGVDITHPDLNIYTNPVEASGQAGVDDDGNGLIDDVHGWDFTYDDNDPSPDIEDGPHGTCVAGVAAAIGNNSIGVVGASFGSAILPVRVSFGSDEEATEESDAAFDASVAEALRYAAKHADVVNNSWGSSYLSDVVSSALDFATSNQGKRGEKGVPILFASGNDSSFFKMFQADESFLPGTYTIEMVYEKDASGNAGDDCVLISDVAFGTDTMDYIDTIMPFGEIFPIGVESSGDKPFQIVESDMAEFGFVYKSGAIGDNQESVLTWTVDLPEEGYLGVFFRTSTEKDKDLFSIYVDGEEIYGGVYSDELDDQGNEIVEEQPYSGETPLNLVPLRGENTHPKVINIGASNDLDVRSVYSQYGSQMDFVAPSNGGINDIVTTDVSIPGLGYDPDSAYAEDFGGTSSACPLAAGVFALVMTANPDISVAELMDVFQQTSEKIGDVPYDGNGFNEQYGYGKLNAAAAVQLALDMKGTSISNWELF